MKRYSLWDMDNCLTDDAWRAKYIDWDKGGNERYSRYDSYMLEDKPVEQALRVWQVFLELGYTPIIFTGRREQWRSETEQWLRRNLHCIDPLIFMRRNGEEGTPVEVKSRMLQEFSVSMGVLPSDIGGAFDDLPSIIAMYRSHGIPATVLRAHDPHTTYSPKDLGVA